ncbi:MAG: ATP:cob(I)alamin adenosyltransferase [Parcubacteria group bacterium GW2011_GWA1_47_8]|nr:MAG: ATP:cob(I)alamin adenosyltransferase [Parcubacteria group bacterium GW2011_GWA1_47_8]
MAKKCAIVKQHKFWYITWMLYTGKGDDGTTKTFGSCNQRISKSSAVAEALGSLDEINSFLGICKTNEYAKEHYLEGYSFAEMVDWVQQQLFIVQAHVAGADKTIDKEKIIHMEQAIDMTEKELPPIKTFFVSGGTTLAAQFDFARTLARRAERRVVGVSEEGKAKVDANILAFLNRLSSLLYAMARLANYKSGITEEPPSYR